MKAMKKSIREKLQRRFARNRKKRARLENVGLAAFSILFILPLFYYVGR